MGISLAQAGSAQRAGLAKTGIVGLLDGDPQGPTVALRADIDGLPLADAKQVPYRSRIEGRLGQVDSPRV